MKLTLAQHSKHLNSVNASPKAWLCYHHQPSVISGNYHNEPMLPAIAIIYQQSIYGRADHKLSTASAMPSPQLARQSCRSLAGRQKLQASQLRLARRPPMDETQRLALACWDRVSAA